MFDFITPLKHFWYLVTKYPAVASGVTAAVIFFFVGFFSAHQAARVEYSKQYEQRIESSMEIARVDTESRLREEYTKKITELTSSYESKLKSVSTTTEVTTKKPNGEVIIVKKTKVEKTHDTQSNTTKVDKVDTATRDEVKKAATTTEKVQTQVVTKEVEKKVVEYRSITISGVISQDSVNLRSLNLQPRYGIMLQKNFSSLSVGVSGSYRHDNTSIGVGLSLGWSF